MGRDLHASAETTVGLSDKAKVSINLAVSPDTDAAIEGLAVEFGGSKADVFTNGLALLALAVDAKKRGKHLAVVGPDGSVEVEIPGL